MLETPKSLFIISELLPKDGIITYDEQEKDVTMGNQQVSFDKKCKNCKKKFKASGPAGVWCESCMLLNKYEKIEKGIKYNALLNIYNVAMKRSDKNYHRRCYSLEEAKAFMTEINNKVPKQDMSGLNSTWVKAFGKSPYHNFFQVRNKIRKQDTFKCEYCASEVPTSLLTVHHIDHNRLNDNTGNFAIWCKKCHQTHHTNRDNKNGRYIKETPTTIPSGSTPQAYGGGSGSHSE